MPASDFDSTEAPTPQELRELTESAARLGGRLSRESFGQPRQVEFKDDHSEVTEVDIAVEQAIIEHIRSRRPHDAFIGEETTQRCGEGEGDFQHMPAGQSSKAPQASPSGSARVHWIIDSIDGTRNYVRGIPIFCCSVAAMWRGWPMAGAIYDPIHEVMYSAAAGQGVCVNGRRVRLSSKPKGPAVGSPEQLLVGIPSALRSCTQRLVRHAVERQVVRNLGSVALHLALVATGQFDATICANSKLWDVAAGALMVMEAGGLATTPDGKPVFPLEPNHYAGEEIPLLAGHPAACDQLRLGAG